MKRKLVVVGTAALMAVSGLIGVQPAFAAEQGCGVYANTPTRGTNPTAVKATGGRRGCDTSKSTTVYLKGVRSGLPDSVLAKGSAQLKDGSLTVSYGSPTNGARYQTQTEDTTGGSAESAILTW